LRGDTQAANEDGL